jgi:hypothetical protein
MNYLLLTLMLFDGAVTDVTCDAVIIGANSYDGWIDINHPHTFVICYSRLFFTDCVAMPIFIIEVVAL